MSEYAEQSVAAACLLEPSLAKETGLTVQDFNNHAYQRIFLACQQMPGKDMMDIMETLERSDPGSRDFCMGLVSETAGMQHWDKYAEIISNRSNVRKAARMAEELADHLRSADSLDGIWDRLQQFNGLMSCTGQEYTISQCLDAAMEGIIRRRDGDSGISTGLESVDKHLGGLHEGDLVVIGARPAMGKTALIVNMALRAGVPAGIISTEQGAGQIGERMLAFTDATTVASIRSGRCNDAAIEQGISKLGDTDVHVFDNSAPDIAMIKTQCRKWATNGIKVVFIDYLQRIRGDSKLPKHERVGEIAREMKTLARDLKMPIVCLAQLNRGAEQDRRPQMSDLKDSGDIEQEADQILLLYKPEVHDWNVRRYDVELVLGKNRHGPTGVFTLLWEAEYMRFSDK